MSTLADYLDEEAARELCAEVEVHLRACGPCKVEVDKLRKTILIYRSETDCPPLCDDARKRLFRVLSYEYRSTRRSTS